jgi:DNA-binding LacI/PurR family transcriptional regulator
MTQGSSERSVTLQVIADALGVSRSTISNAYNHPDHLSPDLLAKVLETAKELSYPGPSPMGRKLRTGRNHAVGLVCSDSLSYAFNDEASIGFLRGLALACENAKTSLLMIPDDSEQIIGAAVDSLVVYSVPEQSPLMDAALSKNIPIVIVDGANNVDSADFVGLDQRGSAGATARYLAGMGHRHVAILCHRLHDDGYVGYVDERRVANSTYTVQRERVEGFRDAFLEATDGRGVIRMIERIVSNVTNGRMATEALLLDFPDVTAISTTCDALALGVLVAAEQLGLTAPDDLSVAGFDDIPSAVKANLTTTWQPLIEKGEVAGEMLLGHATNLRSHRRHLLPTKLQIRATTGKAKT